MHDQLNPDSEIISLRTEICQLEDAAREINDKRVGLLRRLDALQSKTRVLPPEVLSLIFQHACVFRKSLGVERLVMGKPPRSRDLFCVFLGSISHSWRQVAWSAPRLWTTLSFFVDADKFENAASVLELYFTNVRGLPITLRLIFDYDYAPSPEDDSLARILFKEENLQKLETLKLLWPPASWLTRFSNPFSQLVKISLAGDGDWTPITNAAFLSNAPNLRTMSLRCINPSLNAPWSLITILKLKEVSAAGALRCLIQSPNLVEFYYIYPTYYPDFGDDDVSDEEGEDPPELSDVLTLHHLQTLHWSFKLNFASDLFLHRIKLPALRSLTWDQREKPVAGAFSPGIQSFFRNLFSASLTTLHIHGMLDMDATLAKHIYYENPQIENLVFERCSEGSLCYALASLSLGWNSNGQIDESRYLTKLKRVEINGCVPDQTDHLSDFLGETFGDIVAELLMERASVDFNSSLCIDLVLKGVTRVRWREGAKGELRAFWLTGAVVRLLMDGRQIDWLQ